MSVGEKRKWIGREKIQFGYFLSSYPKWIPYLDYPLEMIFIALIHFDSPK
jgi:hypothetical protein